MKIVVSYDDYDGTVLAYSDEEKTVPMDVNYVLKGHIQMITANIDDKKMFDHIDITQNPAAVVLKDKPLDKIIELSQDINTLMDSIMDHETNQDKSIMSLETNVNKMSVIIDGLIKNIQNLKGGDK